MTATATFPHSPASLSSPASSSMAAELGLDRRPLSSSEYLHLAEAGLFEGERIELIEGEILKMSPIGSPHGWIVSFLARELQMHAGERRLVAIQSTLRLSERSTVEPDLTVLREAAAGYRAPHPGAADALLVIEVAESSLRYDLGPKARLYAKTGIVEYWVVVLERETVVVHRDPGPEGYRSITEHPADSILSPDGQPDLAVDFSRVFRRS